MNITGQCITVGSCHVWGLLAAAAAWRGGGGGGRGGGEGGGVDKLNGVGAMYNKPYCSWAQAVTYKGTNAA